MKNKPYTYLIGWSNLDRWYYGVRYSSDCCPSDLWVSYFTSSKKVKNCRKKYGEPDVVEVRKVFENETTARLWEEKVLRRMKVTKTDRWLNLNVTGAFPPLKGEDHPNFGNKWSDIQKQKQSKRLKGILKGVPKSEDHKQKISQGRKKDWKNNNSLKESFSKRYTGEGNPMWGKTTSDYQKQRVSESLYGKPKSFGKLWEVTFPDGHKEVVKGLDLFARKHGLNPCNLRGVAYGTSSHHKGFIVKKILP